MENNDLIFIAKYPVGDKQRDGACIRFLEIDNIYKNYNRIYAESFSFPLKTLIYTILKDIKHKFLFKASYKNDKILSYKYINKKTATDLFEKAKLIYVESHGNLIMLPPEMIKKYGHKMILDCHGCAVEESIMSHLEQWKIDNLSYYEKLAFKYIKQFIVVSDNMKQFFTEKFPEAKNAEFTMLPIFPNKSIEYHDKKTDTINLIYSGRNYIWQNSDLMMKSISEMINNNTIKNINYSFLTPDIEYYMTLAKKYNIDKNITIKSVAPNELNQEYAKAHLGLILREDNVVNRIACPTKLVEYMKTGIIPVVLQPEIGDFNNLGYKYILISDLVKGNIPDINELEEMRRINYKVIQDIQDKTEKSKQKLLSMLGGKS